MAAQKYHSISRHPNVLDHLKRRRTYILRSSVTKGVTIGHGCTIAVLKYRFSVFSMIRPRSEKLCHKTLENKRGCVFCLITQGVTGCCWTGHFHYEQNDDPEPVKFLVELIKIAISFGNRISKQRQSKHLALEWFAKGGLDLSQKSS